MAIKAAGVVLIAEGPALPAVAPGRTPAPEGAQVCEGAQFHIVAPADGETVANPVTMVFGLAGIGVAPAGHGCRQHRPPPPAFNTAPALIDHAGALPATDAIIHSGGGQTRVMPALPAGTHGPRLRPGDRNHFQHEPPDRSR